MAQIIYIWLLSLGKIKKADVIAKDLNDNSDPRLLSTSGISIADIFKNINTDDADFLKYIPNQFLNENQKKVKAEALKKDAERISRFSGRDEIEIGDEDRWAQ